MNHEIPSRNDCADCGVSGFPRGITEMYNIFPLDYFPFKALKETEIPEVGVSDIASKYLCLNCKEKLNGD